MISSLYLENFRAFKSQHIDLGVLNIFVGPNNSGKSSIISAINLIAQNATGGLSDFSLALNGPHAQLGTFYDVVHGHSSRSRMRIAFSLDNIRYDYRFRYRPQRREIDLIRAEISSGSQSYLYIKNDDKTSQEFRTSKSRVIVLPASMRPRFRGLSMRVPFYMVPPERLNFSQDDLRHMRDFMVRATRNLDRHFYAFDSVGAFRAAPERTYHYTGEAPANVGRQGENCAQMLASSSSTRERASTGILRKAAAWFQESGVAQDVKVNSLTNRHFEIIVKDSVGLQNNIIDSGFGCSQVLPVLVSGYNLVRERRSISPPVFVVQEPEIHLHPTAAAHLGTYFVELANQGVQSFVETHSENLILRVARHIAEGALGKNDVKIYWVGSESGEHSATELKINDDGTFSSEWPEGFFPTRASETLMLARAASARRNNKKTIRE